MNGPTTEEIETQLHQLRRHNATLVAARSMKDALAMFMAAAHARNTARAIARRLSDLVSERSVLASLIEQAIAEHESVLAEQPLFVVASDASRISRWSAARDSVKAERREDPDLFELNVRNADIGAIHCESLYIAEAWLQSVSLAGSVFDRATVQDCDFWESDLSNTSWRGARVVRCSFQACDFVDARLDDATFIDCVFYRSDLGASRSTMRPTARRTTFSRCDLRLTSWQGRILGNTKFDRCRMHGIGGSPVVESVEIDRPDLTRAGDGMTIGNAQDVLRLWRVQATRT
jgi:hypothetical protein